MAKRRELAIDVVPASSGFVTEIELPVAESRLAIFAISSGALEITPKNRTGPFLPSSAMLMEMVAL
jgi:hypothetical protein